MGIGWVNPAFTHPSFPLSRTHRSRFPAGARRLAGGRPLSRVYLRWGHARGAAALLTDLKQRGSSRTRWCSGRRSSAGCRALERAPPGTTTRSHSRTGSAARASAAAPTARATRGITNPGSARSGRGRCRRGSTSRVASRHVYGATTSSSVPRAVDERQLDIRRRDLILDPLSRRPRQLDALVLPCEHHGARPPVDHRRPAADLETRCDGRIAWCSTGTPPRTSPRRSASCAPAHRARGSSSRTTMSQRATSRVGSGEWSRGSRYARRR